MRFTISILSYEDKRRSSAAIFLVDDGSEMVHKWNRSKLQEKHSQPRVRGGSFVTQSVQFQMKTVFSKLICTCPEEHFEQLFWIQSFEFFPTFSGLWLVLLKIFSTCPRDHFQPQLFWRLSKLFNFFRTLSNKFSTAVVKTASTCPQEHVERILLKINIWWSHNWQIIREKSRYWADNFPFVLYYDEKV